MRRHPALVYVLLVLLLPAIVGTPRAVAVERPPRLAPSGCELWIGRGSGNDPSMQIELRLCPQPDGRVSGEVQWSSTTSGWNLRDVSGRYEAGGTGITLRDDRITAQRPEPGWRFCTIDRYALARNGDHLSGPYHSSACSDDGTLTLDRVANAAGQPVPAPPALPGTSDTPSPAPATPSPGPAPPSLTPPPPPPSRGPFGCSL